MACLLFVFLTCVTQIKSSVYIYYFNNNNKVEKKEIYVWKSEDTELTKYPMPETSANKIKLEEEGRFKRLHFECSLVNTIVG